MSYIEIVKSADGITLKLTPAGREELSSRLDSLHSWDARADSILEDLLEDHLQTGWEFIQPEEIGALTSSPLLSDEVGRDAKENIANIGKVYWFPDYAIRSELDELYNNGEVFFPAAQEIEKEPALINTPCPSDDCPSHDLVCHGCQTPKENSPFYLCAECQTNKKEVVNG